MSHPMQEKGTTALDRKYHLIYLLSPLGERTEVRGQRLWLTLTPTLSHQGRGRTHFHGSRAPSGHGALIRNRRSVNISVVL